MSEDTPEYRRAIARTDAAAETRVRLLAAEFAESWKRTLDLAVQLAVALIELKAELGHGKWLPWVEESFPLGERMARNFMSLADP
jgi:hypothetical protein